MSVTLYDLCLIFNIGSVTLWSYCSSATRSGANGCASNVWPANVPLTVANVTTAWTSPSMAAATQKGKSADCDSVLSGVNW